MLTIMSLFKVIFYILKIITSQEKNHLYKKIKITLN
jgi:hypothetical protein